MPPPLKKHRLALVLSGGGARGAYEAGIIHYIRTKLPKEIALKRLFNIQCGSSVGAINSCFMASTAHDLKTQGALIYGLWRELKQDNIYKRNITALSQLVGRSVIGVSKNIFGVGQASQKGHFAGLLDTVPFHNFLNKVIDWNQLHRNVDARVLDAVSLTATNMSSGHMELFIEKNDDIAYTGAHPAHFTQIHANHARASAAIPIVFPSVEVDRMYYADGGLRLNTPLSPAIQLGADRLLVIGLHPLRSKPLEELTSPGVPLQKLMGDDWHNTPPRLGEIIGIVLNSLFLDRIDYDLEQMERINRIIHWGEMAYGDDFVGTVNAMLTKKKIRGDIANRGLKRLKAFSIFPSHGISEIFAECLSNPKLVKDKLGSVEKFILRILDVDPAHGQNFLSYLMFIPEYIKRVLDLGFEDARSHHDDLVEFLSESAEAE